jgi:hypothetical protein
MQKMHRQFYSFDLTYNIGAIFHDALCPLVATQKAPTLLNYLILMNLLYCLQLQSTHGHY